MKRIGSVGWAWVRLLGWIGWLSGSLLGQETRPFRLGEQLLELTPATAGESVFLRGLRPLPAGGWSVDVVISNGAPRLLKGPVVLRFDRAEALNGAPPEFQLDAGGRPFLDVAPFLPESGLESGKVVSPFTVILPVTSGVPRVEARLYVAAVETRRLGVGRTLDGRGLPLEGVEVTVGSSAPVRSGRGGWVTVPAEGTRAMVRFSKEGFLPVWREASGPVGSVVELGSPRLVARAGDVAIALTAQTLPARLPSGWSPLAAVAIPAPAGGLARLIPSVAVGADEVVAVVRWDEVETRWVTFSTGRGGGINPVEVPLTSAGVVTLVVADGVPSAPPVPTVGTELLGGVGVAPATSTWTATGKVDPSSRPAARDPLLVTARAEVDFRSSSGPLASGLTVRCEITEEYRLRDGTRRVLPRYETTVSGYQRPGAGAGVLRAEFPLRPFQLLAGEELAEAVVRVQVLAPTGFAGAVLGAGGGETVTEGVRVRAATGDLAGSQATVLRVRTLEELGNVPLPGAATVVFELDVTGVVPGRTLRADFVPDVPNQEYVLGRVIFDEGRFGLQPVARYRSDAAGLPQWVEPASGGLTGIDGGGMHVLVRVGGRQAVVSGVARGRDGSPRAGFELRSGGWTAFSGADGRYRLVAPAGATVVGVLDPATGDTGSETFDVASNLAAVARDLSVAARGPRVVRVSPVNGATDVSRVTPVEWVFDEPVATARVVAAGAVQLLVGTNALPFSISLSPARTVLTLLPTTTLPPEAEVVLKLARTITDSEGLPLEGVNEFRFVTETDRVRRTDIGLEIHEPLEGVARMVGGPGIADPRSAVILVNETTGETSTVVSRADGSFNDFIRAGVDDDLRAVLVNRNGSRTEIAPVKQIFRDGSVGLFATGGEVAASGETGEVRLKVEPGAVDGRVILKLEPMKVSDFTALVGGLRPPESGPFVGAFVLTESGAPLRASMDVSFPVEVASLGLPAGVDPTNAVYGVVMPVQLDGKRFYQIVDTATFVPEGPGRGRIVTQSPPFTGVLARKLAEAARGAGLNPTTPRVAEAEKNPHLGETAAFGILPLTFSQGLKVAGKVVSVRLDPSGDPVGEARPVTGAIVRVETAEAGVPGLFTEGDTLSVSDDTGHFGFFYRPSAQAGARALVATHPRFPFQTANAGGFATGGRVTTAVAAELRFAENGLSNTAVEGTERPVLKISHAPVLPVSGLAEGDGATLTLVAVDDVSAGVPTLTVVQAVNARGETVAVADVQLVAVNPTIPVEEGGAEPAPVTRRVTQWKLRMKQAGRVLLKGTVADNGGRTDVTEYSVIFGGSRPVLQDPGAQDTFGSRVIFSWPPEGATNVPSLLPIRVRFNEPVPAEFLAPEQLGWIAFDAGHFLRRVDASADRREITLWYDGDRQGAVRLTLGVTLTDQAGNEFDQDDQETGNQPFTLDFEQSGDGLALLGESLDGAGAVLLGRYAYVLDRRTGNGRLVAFDLLKPDAPVKVSALDLPDRPTALALVQGYELPVGVNAGTGAFTGKTTNDLIAVFTGSATQNKRLRLVRIANGQMVSGPSLSLNGGNLTGGDGTGANETRADQSMTAPPTMVVQAKWDPPFLGYFELGADVTSVVLLNLTSFDVAAKAGGRLTAFPLRGTVGNDANGDNDYADAGDLAPLPMRDAFQPPGLAFSFAPADPKERIQDFDFSSGLGLVVTAWQRIGTDPAGGLRVVLAATSTNDLTNAVVSFPPEYQAKRVTLLLAQELRSPDAPAGSDDGLQVLDIALVSLLRLDGGSGALAVVDVTEPFAPVLRQIVPLPAGEGAAQSVQRRADGLLAVATSQSTLLLESRDLLLPANGDEHPAFRGRLDGVGNGVRAFVADVSGINVTYGGGRRQVVLSEPRFTVMRFPSVFDPKTVAEQSPAIVEGFLRRGSVVQVIEPTLAGTGVPPLDPLRNYYVLVDAPGGSADAQGRLKLALVAVDRQGRPQPEKGGTLVPAVVGDSQLESALLVRRVVELIGVVVNFKRAATETVPTAVQRFTSLLRNGLNIGILLSKLGAFGDTLSLLPPDFTAQRLSSDPNHPLYNRYLAGPFLVLGGAPTEAELKAIVDQSATLQVTRPLLRPSPRLWVGLPSRRQTEITENPAALDRFTARFRLNPTLAVAGVSIPHSTELLEALTAANQTVPGSIGSILNLGDGAAVLVGALNSIPLLNMILKGDLEPTLFPGAHTLVRVNYNDRPLVLVPGFGASRLHIDRKERWLGGLEEILLNRLKHEMELRPDGTPLLETQVTDALRYALEPVELKSYYGDWIQQMKVELHYVEYEQLEGSTQDPTLPGRRRRLDGAPVLSQDPTPDLFVFPYDWRVDNQKSAEKLRDYVRLIREIHPDADGIDLVCHSNGGLVGRAYLLLPGQRPLVKRFISVGTPWLGASKILAGVTTGELNDMSLNIAGPIGTFRRLLQFYPAGHQFLPAKELFALGIRPLIEDGQDVNTNGFGHQTFNFEQYLDVLGKHLLRESAALAGAPLSLQPGGVHPAVANLTTFRSQAIADHRDDAGDVEMHHIFGMGCTPDTIGQLRLLSRLVPVIPTNNAVADSATGDAFEPEEPGKPPGSLVRFSDGQLPVSSNQFRLSKEVELRFVSGDGTVPIASLARGAGSAIDFNAPHAKVHSVVAGFGESESGHNPMLNTPQFFRLFSDLITGRAVDHLTVQISAPIEPAEGSTGLFNFSASGAGPGAGELSWVVDYGDGTVELYRGAAAGSQTQQHRYRQSGTYTVSVGVTTDKTDSERARVTGFKSTQVTVRNVAPTVVLEGMPTTASAGDTVLVSARVTDPGTEDSFSYRWTLPESRIEGRHQFVVPVTFGRPGTQTVKVEVEDQDGGIGTATASVTVQPTAPLVGPGFADHARLPRSARPQSLPGFEGGQPEILVRIVGVAPIGEPTLETAALIVQNQRGVPALVDQALDLSRMVVVTALPLGADPSVLLGAATESLDAIRTSRDRFVGKFARDVEMIREVRERTTTVPLIGALAGLLGQDLSVKTTVVAGLPTNRPWMMDVLYLKGGEVQRLTRWSNSIASGVGFRLRWNWVTEQGQVEMVASDGTLGPLIEAAALSNLLPLFDTANPAMAADRLGPAVAGVLNPATDQIDLLARDNFTASGKLRLYLAFDANENGRLDDDIFYEMTTNRVDRSRLTARPFAILSQDEQGNIGDLDPFVPVRTQNFLLGDTELPEPQRYRARLNAVREAVRGAVSEGLSDALTQKFLLDPAHLWVFEQGSGAGLWRSENLDAVVQACNRNYIPGKSDNDYELFLPASLGQNLNFNPAGRAAFVAQGPLRDETLIGDWYFLTPLGLDEGGALTDDSGAVVRWLYRLPQGSALSDGAVEFEVAKVGPGQPLSAGFSAPFTPAEVIAQVMRAKVRDVPARARLLPDTTFYAERREHFMFGQAHLARPQAAGDDTLGDAGMGRQMLLLKWVLEGAFVTAPSTPGLNASLPLAPTAFLDAIHGNWVTAGVPLAEGYEWGVFQEYAALAARPGVRAALRFGTPEAPVLRRFADDAIAAQERGKIKKLGKSAIRAALARLAGDPELRGALNDISPTAYRERGLQSFEEYILATIRGSEKARQAFGRLVEDLDDVTETPDLGDWLRAKQGHDEGYVQLLLADPAIHRRYVAATFDFLRRTVQAPTQPHHEAFIQSLIAAGRTDELALRLSNLHRVVNGAPGQPGIRELARALRLDVDLPVEVSSWGPGGFTGVDVQLRDADGEGAGGSGPAPRRAARPLLDATLGTGIVLTAFEEEALGNESGEALAVVSEEGIPTLEGEPVVEMTLEGNPVQASKQDDAFAVTMERMPVGEPVVAPNPFFTLFVAGPNRTTAMLDDWPATGTRPRSPATTIGLADRIEVFLLGSPRLTGLEAEFSSESSPNRIRRPLLETQAGSGLYEIAPGQTPVRLTLSRTDPARLFVPDENLIRVKVTGPSMPAGGLIEEVMVDAAELAIATVKHEDRGPELKPRFDYRDLLTGSPLGPRMFLQGFLEFDDNVAAVVNNGDNAMRRMLQNFAGPQFPDSGEADWLYVHAHGSKDGRILDHNQINNAPAGRILAPVTDLADERRWSRDADFFISEACSILNPGIDRNGDPITDEVAGRVNWELVMRSSPRPIHAVLGFIFAKVASRKDTRTFIDAMQKGQEIGLSWFRSMDGVQREWGILYFVGTEPDSLYRMTQDRGPQEPIDFIAYRGTVGDDLGDDLDEAVAAHELWPGLWAPAGFAAGPELPGSLPAWRGARWNPGLNPGSGERYRIRDLGGVLEFGQPSLPGALDAEAPPENFAQVDAERFLQSHSPTETAAWRLDRSGRILASRSEVTGRTEERLVARQFHFRRQLDGIPVHGSRASIEIRAAGVSRGSSVRSWTPAEEAGPVVGMQPMGWCLERWWRDEGPPDPRRVSRGELVWAPARAADGAVRLVPAWCFRMTGADATGRAVGEWVELILDARTGRGMEAEVLP